MNTLRRIIAIIRANHHGDLAAYVDATWGTG